MKSQMTSTRPPLPATGTAHGDLLTLRKLHDRIGWYDRAGSIVEIHVMSWTPASTFKGTPIDAYWRFCGDSKFGQMGWCYSDPDKVDREIKAQRKFDELVDALEERSS
tara:strand:+ start:1307 stop:1630 length:324 start_codon:yes stop_codon:yes gene_type:complete